MEQTIWSLLERASADRKHDMHLCSVSTVDSLGYPEARMVVLRAASAANKTLSFHTDIRSRKAKSLHNLPYLTMLFWDKSSSVQLSIRCLATIHHKDPLAQLKLSMISLPESILYACDKIPAEVLEKFEGDSEFTFRNELIPEHFCWIECTTVFIDFLHLGRGKAAHTRAKFSYENSRLIEANYVKA
ncbi:MAG: pyridoxamine 5'-phosphate oxidase family protein [Cyclobacteriaceae bacterium]|nr:pyridoxamine 5'-phosphate oxidase family protein [Cyclobacteriaceae bacterium]